MPIIPMSCWKKLVLIQHRRVDGWRRQHHGRQACIGGADIIAQKDIAVHGDSVAALQGNSAAAGAATGELAVKAIAGVLYPGVTYLSKQSEEQKQTVSALATISAGMAGGLAGDCTGSAVAGGQAGKNAAENNTLALVARGCAVAAPCRRRSQSSCWKSG